MVCVIALWQNRKVIKHVYLILNGTAVPLYITLLQNNPHKLLLDITAVPLTFRTNPTDYCRSVYPAEVRPEAVPSNPALQTDLTAIISYFNNETC